MSEILRLADLVVPIIPVDATAFRSMLPFLEYLQEQRARPNRRFETRAVINEPSTPHDRTADLSLHLSKYLSPILAGIPLPHDLSIAKDVSNGKYPATPGQALKASLEAVFESLLSCIDAPTSSR